MKAHDFARAATITDHYPQVEYVSDHEIEVKLLARVQRSKEQVLAI